MRMASCVALALAGMMAFGSGVWAQTPAPSDKDKMMEKDKSGSMPIEKGAMEKGKMMDKGAMDGDKMSDKGMMPNKDTKEKKP